MQISTDEEVIGGAIVEMLRRAEEKLRSHNRTAVDITSSLHTKWNSRIQWWHCNRFCRHTNATLRYAVEEALSRFSTAC